MSIWNECVIDASMGCSDGMFCFCPIEGDITGQFSLVTGLNYISKAPHGSMRLVGIVHPDGNDAVERSALRSEAEIRREAFKEAITLVQSVTNENDLDDGGFFEAGFIAARTKSIDALIAASATEKGEVNG